MQAVCTRCLSWCRPFSLSEHLVSLRQAPQCLIQSFSSLREAWNNSSWRRGLVSATTTILKCQFLTSRNQPIRQFPSTIPTITSIVCSSKGKCWRRRRLRRIWHLLSMQSTCKHQQSQTRPAPKLKPTWSEWGKIPWKRQGHSRCPTLSQPAAIRAWLRRTSIWLWGFCMERALYWT